MTTHTHLTSKRSTVRRRLMAASALTIAIAGSGCSASSLKAMGAMSAGVLQGFSGAARSGTGTTSFTPPGTSFGAYPTSSSILNKSTSSENAQLRALSQAAESLTRTGRSF